MIAITAFMERHLETLGGIGRGIFGLHPKKAPQTRGRYHLVMFDIELMIKALPNAYVSQGHRRRLQHLEESGFEILLNNLTTTMI